MSVSVPLCDKSLFKGVQPSWIHCIVLKTGRILCAHHDSYLGGKNVRNKRSITTELWKLCRVCHCSWLLNLLPVKSGEQTWKTVWSSHRRYQWELLRTGEWLWWVQRRRGIDERSVSHRWEDQVWWRRYRSSCEMAHALMPFKHRSVPHSQGTAETLLSLRISFTKNAHLWWNMTQTVFQTGICDLMHAGVKV